MKTHLEKNIDLRNKITALTDTCGVLDGRPKRFPVIAARDTVWASQFESGATGELAFGVVVLL